MGKSFRRGRENKHCKEKNFTHSQKSHLHNCIVLYTKKNHNKKLTHTATHRVSLQNICAPFINPGAGSGGGLLRLDNRIMGNFMD